MKKIISIFVCISILLFTSVTAWNPAENKDFFVDPETGEPNAIVVVGANAAASDVTAASWIATQIGSICTYKETKIYTYFSGENYKDRDPDVILVGNAEGYFKNDPYVELESLWYDDKNKNGLLDSDESREEVFVDFTSVNDVYPAIEFYNFQYRTVIKGKPETETWHGENEDYVICTKSAPFKFLGELYELVTYGHDDDYGDYIIYGTPHKSHDKARGDDRILLEVGERKEFYGWEITLKEVNVYGMECTWSIKGPNDNEPKEYKVKLGNTSIAVGVKEKIGDEEIVTFCVDTVKFMIDAYRNDVAVGRLYALTDSGVIKDADVIQICGAEGYLWDLDVEFDKDITLTMKNHMLLDSRIYGSEWDVSLCKWDFPKEGINDFDVNRGDAPRYLELTIDDSGDLNHTDLVITKGFSVTYYTQETKHVKIDPMSLIVNDDEVTETMKATKNLVLVGGPGLVETPQGAKTCNILTKKLCDDGLSTVNWFYSVGEYEYIANAFTEDKDVIIVAGKDREATQKAIEKLINDLNI